MCDALTSPQKELTCTILSQAGSFTVTDIQESLSSEGLHVTRSDVKHTLECLKDNGAVFAFDSSFHGSRFSDVLRLEDQINGWRK